jgi:hypothetical protein
MVTLFQDAQCICEIVFLENMIMIYKHEDTFYIILHIVICVK